MKNKWGIGIAIFYTSFVVVMVGFVIYTAGVNTDLVRDDYYAEDIAFQEKYNKKMNAKELEQDLIIRLDKSEFQLFFIFPQSMKKIKGKISFYKPDNKKLDHTIDIKVDDINTQKISTSKHPSGAWRILVDWEGNDTKYFTEKKLSL